jgi:hypothetical protein
MGTTVDLTQGRWRLHTALGIMSMTDLKLHPAQPSGPNSDAVLTFEPYRGHLDLPEGVALTGAWYLGKLHPEDPGDTDASKGTIRVKIVPAVPAAHPSQQVIQIYQTNYVWTTGDYTGDITIYTGLLHQPTPAGQPAAPPVFFGYGADNAGRQWLTFSLAPADVLV